MHVQFEYVSLFGRLKRTERKNEYISIKSTLDQVYNYRSNSIKIYKCSQNNPFMIY